MKRELVKDLLKHGRGCSNCVYASVVQRARMCFFDSTPTVHLQKGKNCDDWQVRREEGCSQGSFKARKEMQ